MLSTSFYICHRRAREPDGVTQTGLTPLSLFSRIPDPDADLYIQSFDRVPRPGHAISTPELATRTDVP